MTAPDIDDDTPRIPLIAGRIYMCESDRSPWDCRLLRWTGTRLVDPHSGQPAGPEWWVIPDGHAQ